MNFKPFSQRNNYTKVSNVIIRETITEEIQNAICTCIDNLENNLYDLKSNNTILFDLEDVELKLWTDFFNQRRNDFYCGYRERKLVITPHILDRNVPWYSKLDIIEFILLILRSAKVSGYHSHLYVELIDMFIKQLNSSFSRLNYGYRIVDDKIVDITSEDEIRTIEQAMQDNSDSVRTHLDNALKLYSQRPQSDCRNSIKEAISAVEAYCREKTGEDTLGKALKHLEDNGIHIHRMLNDSFTKLYVYTNDKTSGIRHALMDTEVGYSPSKDEAYYMIVTCSAFINYLNMKVSKK